MEIYIYLYLILSLSLFFPLKTDRQVRNIFLILLISVFILFVGLRYKVGGDWGAYFMHFDNLDMQPLLYNLISWDPGYVLVEYISKVFGLGIYGVNTISAILFFSGFIYFANAFNIKVRYAFLIAFPYLIMVVVNGYTRQGVALGLLMAMYGAFYKNKFFKSFLLYMLAVLFHKTAIIGGIIYLYDKKIAIRWVLFIIPFVLIAYKFFENNFLVMSEYYFVEKMQSSGGIIRILVNVSAAILFFIFYRRWKLLYSDYRIWQLFSLITIFVFIFTIFTKATTVGDRILLYFYPLQIVVFERVISLIKDRHVKHIYFFILISLYWGILLVWLNFASNRFNWLPYNNLLFRILG